MGTAMAVDDWMLMFTTGLLYDVVSSALEGCLPDLVGLLLGVAVLPARLYMLRMAGATDAISRAWLLATLAAIHGVELGDALDGAIAPSIRAPIRPVSLRVIFRVQTGNSA